MPFTIAALMTIAAMGALAIGAAEEATAVAFLFPVGETLEGAAAGPGARGCTSALAVLRIGCSCALVISTPAAIAAGLSTGARRAS